MNREKGASPVYTEEDLLANTRADNYEFRKKLKDTGINMIIFSGWFLFVACGVVGAYYVAYLIGLPFATSSSTIVKVELFFKAIATWVGGWLSNDFFKRVVRSSD